MRKSKDYKGNQRQTPALCTKAPVVCSVIKSGNLPKVAWKGRISWIPQMSCLRIGSGPLDLKMKSSVRTG